MLGSTLTRYTEDDFLCLDTETEGLNLAVHRPWQIAWALASTKEVKTIKSAYIWWPDLCISEGAAAVTRFDYAAYKAQARPATEVWEEFSAHLYAPNTRAVWQNGLRIDIFMLANWARAIGKTIDPAYLFRSIDTDTLSKAKIKGWLPDIASPEAWLAWQYKAANYIETGLKTNLAQMGKAEGIEHDYTSLHEATSDILLMYKVLQKRLWQVEF